MDLRMFSQDEFIRVAFGDQGVAIWHDRCAGAKLGELAEKYGIEYVKMNILLGKIKKHMTFYNRRFLVEHLFPSRAVIHVVVAYCSYKTDIPEQHRQKCVNAVLDNYGDIYSFINAPERDLLAMRGVGEKMLEYILKLQKECRKATHVGSALAE